MSIRSRSHGRWQLRVYVGRDPATGRKLYKEATIKGTKREALKEHARLVTAIESGTELNAKHLSVSDYMAEWLDKKRPNLKATTFNRYEIIVRCHVAPVVGNLPLAKLKPLHIEKVLAVARDKSLSERTQLHIYRAMFSALRQATKWQLVPRNVCEAVEAPRPRSKRIEALEPEQAHLVLKAVAATDLEVPTLLGLGVGLRRGEVLALRWAEVDLDEGQAYVFRTLQPSMEFDTPKTHRSSRPVSLPPFVVAALRSHRKAQNERRLLCGAGWQDLDLVVDRGDGGPMRPDTVSKRFAKATRAMGMDVTFHALRHGYATLALSAGVPLKHTQMLLGHSSFAVTSDLYSHVSERADQDAARRLDALLFPMLSGVGSKS